MSLATQSTSPNLIVDSIGLRERLKLQDRRHLKPRRFPSNFRFNPRMTSESALDQNNVSPLSLPDTTPTDNTSPPKENDNDDRFMRFDSVPLLSAKTIEWLFRHLAFTTLTNMFNRLENSRMHHLAYRLYDALAWHTIETRWMRPSLPRTLDATTNPCYLPFPGLYHTRNPPNNEHDIINQGDGIEKDENYEKPESETTHREYTLIWHMTRPDGTAFTMPVHAQEWDSQMKEYRFVIPPLILEKTCNENPEVIFGKWMTSS